MVLNLLYMFPGVGKLKDVSQNKTWTIPDPSCRPGGPFQHVPGAVSKHISSHNRFSAKADPTGEESGSWFGHSGGAVLHSI
jgi:hypothetical protein